MLNFHFSGYFSCATKTFFGPPILHFWALSAVSEFGHIFRAGIRAPEKGLAEAILGPPGQKKIRGTEMSGSNWACAVLFFTALPQRTRWLRGLDCYTISLATTCRLNTQARHLTGESRWTCRDWATIFGPKRTNPALRILHPRNFLLILQAL